MTVAADLETIMEAVKGQTTDQGGKPPLSQRLQKYGNELYYEWKKITFPDRKQLWQSVMVVFIFCIFLMLVVTVYDIAVGWAFRTFILPQPTGQ